MSPIARLRGVHVRFEGDLEVLRGVDLEVEPGESLAVTGPSGSGKSTLLNVLGGLLEPSAGSVEVAGEDLAQMGARRRARLRSEHIGFIFQAHHLLPQCSALENVLVPVLARQSDARSHEAIEVKDR